MELIYSGEKKVSEIIENTPRAVLNGAYLGENLLRWNKKISIWLSSSKVQKSYKKV